MSKHSSGVVIFDLFIVMAAVFAFLVGPRLMHSLEPRRLPAVCGAIGHQATKQSILRQVDVGLQYFEIVDLGNSLTFADDTDRCTIEFDDQGFAKAAHIDRVAPFGEGWRL